MGYFGPLEIFVNAAETRSFTEAGKRLAISSSAVGRAVAKLENDLGVRLLHRSTRSIHLTAEGEAFLNRCYRIFEEFAQAKSDLTATLEVPQGKLRVGMPQIATYLMPTLLAFQRRYPRIELEVDFTDRLVNVIDEGFDAVVRIGSVEDSRLTMREIGGYNHLLVASPRYLDQRGVPHQPLDLMSHACLRYRYPSNGKLASWPLYSDRVPLNLDLPRYAITNTIDSLLAMVKDAHGIALLPDFLVAEDLRAGYLKAVLPEHVTDRRNVSVLWPSGSHRQPKVTAFVDALQNVSWLRAT